MRLSKGSGPKAATATLLAVGSRSPNRVDRSFAEVALTVTVAGLGTLC